MRKSVKIKTAFITYLFLIIPVVTDAQQRNLEFYLERAKASSPLINQSKNESKLAELDLQQIRSIIAKPEVNLVSGVMLAPVISHDNNSNRLLLASNDAVNYNGFDIAATDGGQYQAMVSVKQPLLTGSRYKTYAGKTEVTNKISENNIALTVHELEQVVGYQYILCLKSKLQINNSLLLLDELNGQVRILEKLVDNAVYKKTDLMLLQIEVQNYRKEYETFRSEYLTNLYDLNYICGIKDTARVDLQDINFILKTGKITGSGFLTSYKLDSLNILADQAISELKYKPQLDVFADAGLNATYLPGFNRIGLSAGISFSMNIFDGRQRDIQRTKSSVNLQTIEFDKNNFMTQNDISRNRTLNQINAVNRRITLNEQQSDQYAKLYEAYSRELGNGEISIMDFKNLLRDIAARKQETVLLQMEKQLLINSYNYLNY